MTHHGTTILAVRKNGRVALGGDGQVSIGDTVMKAKSVKVRTLKGGKVATIFRDFRLTLLAKRNLLGLAYSLYCSGDLHLVRGGPFSHS